MTEITCPYSWNCGKTFKTAELSVYDFDFVESATKKGMTFMIIHCPKCSREFKFDAVQWKADEFGHSDPNVVVQKKKKTTKQLTTILNKSKIEIPSAYFDYLTSEYFNSEISIYTDEDDFNLYDLNELCDKVNVDGKSYLMIRQLKGFANSLKEILEEIPNKKKEQQFTLTELSNCLAIGYENTRILFIDIRDNNSLWIFHSDGRDDFEKTKMTIDKITKQKK